MKVYTSQLLRGAFDTLMTVVREEASAGLHICSLSTSAFVHFFQLATWFMQYCRYQEEARVSASTKCVPPCTPLVSPLMVVGMKQAVGCASEHCMAVALSRAADNTDCSTWFARMAHDAGKEPSRQQHRRHRRATRACQASSAGTWSTLCSVSGSRWWTRATSRKRTLTGTCKNPLSKFSSTQLHMIQLTR